MADFKVDFLDHVAIRVKDIEVASKWYSNVLGLQRYQFKEWGDFPVFMLSGKTGIALFPANEKDPPNLSTSKNVKIDHFAFQVSADNFNKAIAKYEELNLDYDVQDHFYFHSVYTKDPDGHIVELTTLIKSEKEFYGKSNL